MTAMTQQLIEQIASCPRGEVFLINLHYSVTYGLDPKRFIDMLDKLGRELSVRPPLPSPEKLIEQIDMLCASSDLWQQCDEPRLNFFWTTDAKILSRVTNYRRFCSWIAHRPDEAPISAIPDPLPINGNNPSEVLADDVTRVREFVDTNQWRSDDVPEIIFDKYCNWMAPFDELERRMANGGTNAGDRCRDVVGLSHFKAGEHLIRVDVDLRKWDAVRNVVRRRPNCACSGGTRFLMPYDDPPGCNWGRTVDLEVVAQRLDASMNGVPELVMERFFVPSEAISTSYIGMVIAPPEEDDHYFLARVAHHPRFVHP